jgi:hypothetical protein
MTDLLDLEGSVEGHQAASRFLTPLKPVRWEDRSLAEMQIDTEVVTGNLGSCGSCASCGERIGQVALDQIQVNE